jgi:hypothetical protein
MSVSRSSERGDPLIAARYHRDFDDGFGLTAYGDLGGLSPRMSIGRSLARSTIP